LLDTAPSAHWGATCPRQGSPLPPISGSHEAKKRYCGTPAGWANYAGHIAVRDLILAGPIDVFEAISMDLVERVPDILHRDPGALNRPFGQHVICQPRPGQWWPEDWCTPLAWAVATNKPDAARALLEHGADMTVSSPDGRTLDEMAALAGREQVAAVLEQHRARSRT
jgi:hypothetical protein